MEEAVRAGKIDNVVSCSTEEESLLAKHQLVFSLVVCVGVELLTMCVCVCVFLRETTREEERVVRDNER